jgi:cell fate regulator YaaT (PSP1 superfamily)
MTRMCAVSFERSGKLYYFDPGPYEPRIGDLVLVPTEEGPEVAECVWASEWVSEPVEGLPVLAGMATQDDLDRTADAKRRRAQARVASKRLARELGLDMKVVAVDYVTASNRYTVYFTSAHRIDFRQLVRDLSRTLAGRVELRQLTARDEARVQGGIGPCGRDLCCATFLKDFEPVSVRMAKDQDLPLNPLKISGACGKLMCCLKYEHPLYQAFKASAPALGDAVTTDEGHGRVVGHDVPRDEVVVRLDDGGRRTSCSRASVCGSRHAYESRPGEAQDQGSNR